MDLNTTLDIMAAYNLTFDECMLTYMTLLASDEEGHPEYFEKWFSNGGQEQLKGLFESLKKKGVILKNYSPEAYSPNDIEFNKTFLKGFFKSSYALGRELFDEYPPFLIINNGRAPLKNITKKFYSLEDFFFHYSKTIGHSIKKHNEIMEILRWGKDNDLINYGILEFVASHKWEELGDIKESGFKDNFATTYDIYTE